jgi:hypothetical protein
MADISDSALFDAAMNDAPAEPAAVVQDAPVAEAAPAPVPQPEPVTQAETTPAAEPTVVNEQGHRVPLSEYLGEREKRQAAERRAQEIEQQLNELRRQQRPQPIPDLLESPENYAAHVRQQVSQEARAMVLNMAFETTRAQDQAAFDAAFAALEGRVRAGDTRTRDEIVNAPHPGIALMRWHKQQETLRQIGDGGLDAFRQRALDEALKDPAFRTKAMEAWRTEAQQQPANGSRPSPSLPSVNRLTGSARSADAGPLTDAELFEHATARR